MSPGDTFARLTVVALLPGTKWVNARALVRCECGKETVVRRGNLPSGRTRSCGCLNLERVREMGRASLHGQANTAAGKPTPEYTAWSSAKARVTLSSRSDWENYGGRGIQMCAEWLDDFPAFFAHIGPKPAPDYSLDRIDNDGNYEPGNVRWADRSTQRRNRRDARQVA